MWLFPLGRKAKQKNPTKTTKQQKKACKWGLYIVSVVVILLRSSRREFYSCVRTLLQTLMALWLFLLKIHYRIALHISIPIHSKEFYSTQNLWEKENSIHLDSVPPPLPIHTKAQHYLWLAVRVCLGSSSGFQTVEILLCKHRFKGWCLAHAGCKRQLPTKQTFLTA